MILQALKQLAEREGLSDDPDFEYRRVAWIVCVAEDGKLLGLVETQQQVPAGAGNKPRLLPPQFAVPRFPTGRSGTKAPPTFLVGNAKYVFGRRTGNAEFSEEDGREKSAWFRRLVDECADATSDAGAVAVGRFLRAVAASPSTAALHSETKSNDLFAFALRTPADLVHLRPGVRAFWKVRRAAGQLEEEDRQCVVTGELVSGSALFPPVQGIPGGSTSGVSFVGFNQTAFESHGWCGNENAPLSRTAAEAVSTALARLVSPAYEDPRHPGEKLPRRFVRLSADTVVVFWSPSPAADEFLDSIEGLLEGGTDKAGRVNDLYQSVWRGRAPSVEDTGAFYALTISGTQGRAVLRDWIETSVAAVARNLARYFRDIGVSRHASFREGTEPLAIPLRAMLGALVVPGGKASVPPALAANVVRAALYGTPLPIGLLQRAVLRARAEAGRDDWTDSFRRDARSALIKAVLIRTFHQKVSVSMDPKNSNPGYLLGRLMAVVERMQQAAMGGDVNSTVVDRYFSGASATPAVVFPRLLKNMRNHARKAKDDDKAAGTAGWLESEADNVLKGLTGFPSYLDLEQQGFFVLGYHHERHWLWLPKDQRVTQL